MAVATPILEKRIEDTAEKNCENTEVMSADELHNSKIRRIYAQLINPETKMSDIRPAEPVQDYAPTRVENYEQTISAPQSQEQQVYLVDNARADADIFRADSAINRRVEEVAEAEPQTAMQQAVSEEENEDLMPSRTTMQYSTDSKKDIEEGTISNRDAAKRISLTKRDKVIIAVVVSVIIALFVLIIVNSAIISSVNNDLGSLQSSLNNARNAYQRVTQEANEYRANFDVTLQTLADNLGMVR